MTDLVVCPVCRDVSVASTQSVGDRTNFECLNCGEYAASSSLLASTLTLEERRLSAIQYAALSHRVRVVFNVTGEAPLLTTYSVDEMLSGLQLPTPAEQAVNILRYFGDQVLSSGEAARNPPRSFTATVGSPNRPFALRLVRQLSDRGLLLIQNRAFQGTADEPDGIDLSLDGWNEYEAEKRGQLAGSHGFMALKFYDPELDAFQRDVIKPAVQTLGYRLEDMRDAARAGLIDNVMRARIRDAAFVLVDLTHDNSGAYWEAGYAEGLGKPVLYLCKRAVFDERGTHFDTNHCTTVMWDSADPQTFAENLLATLRRSLGMFSS